MRTWVAVLKQLSVACLIQCASLPALAFVLSNGDEVQCHFSHEGLSGTATEIWNTYNNSDERHPELGRAVAVMRLAADGWPTIIIDAEGIVRSVPGVGNWRETMDKLLGN